MLEMELEELRLSNEELRNLCIRWNWFTCGTNAQYEKLFWLNEDGASIDELALVIWLCSEDIDVDWIVAMIEEEIRKLYKPLLEM